MTKVEFLSKLALVVNLIRYASTDFVRGCLLRLPCIAFRSGRPLVVALAVVAISACNYHEVKGGGGDESPWDNKPSREWPLTYQTLQSRILARHCSRCHQVGGKGQAVLFEPYATLISDSHLRWEAPSATSKIIRAVTRNDRHRMPPPGDGEGLTQDEIDFIGRWIDAGKPEH